MIPFVRRKGVRVDVRSTGVSMDDTFSEKIE